MSNYQPNQYGNQAYPQNYSPSTGGLPQASVSSNVPQPAYSPPTTTGAPYGTAGSYSAPAQGYQTNYTPAPSAPVGGIETKDSSKDSLGAWMLALFVSAIPLVGFIYLLVIAFGGTASTARKNWARAMFLWQIIAVGVSLLLVIILSMAGYFADS